MHGIASDVDHDSDAALVEIIHSWCNGLLPSSTTDCHVGGSWNVTCVRRLMGASAVRVTGPLIRRHLTLPVSCAAVRRPRQHRVWHRRRLADMTPACNPRPGAASASGDPAPSDVPRRPSCVARLVSALRRTPAAGWPFFRVGSVTMPPSSVVRGPRRRAARPRAGGVLSGVSSGHDL